MPISHTEFQPIARHYPIVFTSSDQGKTYAAVAVLGLSAGENLFYGDGRWSSGAYIPAYARRYPFCMARVNVNKVEQKNRLICVEKSALDEESGEAMFDAAGQPSEKWKGVERLLSEYEADLERMREMCALLADYGLLEPFTMQATMKKEKGGGSMQMTGMHAWRRRSSRTSTPRNSRTSSVRATSRASTCMARPPPPTRVRSTGFIIAMILRPPMFMVCASLPTRSPFRGCSTPNGSASSLLPVLHQQKATVASSKVMKTT